jgi:hypothetical protein
MNILTGDPPATGNSIGAIAPVQHPLLCSLLWSDVAGYLSETPSDLRVDAGDTPPSRTATGSATRYV